MPTRSPQGRLAEAIEAWRSDDARERVARWRGDPDAVPAREVHARHARLRGAQARDLLAEAKERGDAPPAVLAALAAALEEAERAPADAQSAELRRGLWARRAPYDSDHFEASALLGRLERTPSARDRRALGAALEPTLHELASRRRDGVDGDAPTTAEDRALAERALDESADAWLEAKARVAHAAGAPCASWTDLAFALRAPRWDDAVRATDRWRRLADGLGALAFPDTIGRAVTVERRRAAPYERCAELACPAVPSDIRIGPGYERGVASERDAAVALGRAICAAMTHPATPPVLRRRLGGLGRAFGSLLAHTLADPEHLGRTRSLAAREGRELGELFVAQELVELRTAAAAVTLRGHAGDSSFRERCEAALREVWAVDEVSGALARALALGRAAAPRLRAAVSGAELFVALRERFDADFWRNPAAAAPIAACARRAGSLTDAEWAEELGAAPTPLGARYEELL